MMNFEKYHFLKKEKEIFYAYHIFIEKSSFMDSNIQFFFFLSNCHILNVFVLILISMQDVNDKH